MIRRLIFPALAAAIAAAPPAAPAADPAPLHRRGRAPPAGGGRAVDPGGRVAGTGLFRRYGRWPRDVPPGLSRARRLRALPPHPPIPRRHDAGPLDPAAQPPGAAEPCRLDRGGARGARAGGEGPGRFPGGWAYFDFGRDAATARALPASRCQACHAEHAAKDNVFVQFYPTLRDLAPRGRGVARSLKRGRLPATTSPDSCPPPFRGVCYPHPKIQPARNPPAPIPSAPVQRANARPPQREMPMLLPRVLRATWQVPAAALLLAAPAALQAQAQATTGVIRGIVADSTGHRCPAPR